VLANDSAIFRDSSIPQLLQARYAERLVDLLTEGFPLSFLSHPDYECWCHVFIVSAIGNRFSTSEHVIRPARY
jgi:hypothetical protein